MMALRRELLGGKNSGRLVAQSSCVMDGLDFVVATYLIARWRLFSHIALARSATTIDECLV